MLEKMKLLKFYSILILLLAIALPSHANERIRVTIIGSSDCQNWTEKRKKTTSGEPLDWVSDIHPVAWVTGYLSALNKTVNENKDVLGAIDTNTVRDWIDRYCIRNPKKDTFDAADELFEELKKITR